MGETNWVVRSFGISLINDFSTWIMAIILVLTIINIMLGVFYDNNK